ncbi:hypothetical protein LPTSP4_36250 [Leptospira ryugenii]|uniref:Uncharacterized protein n=1 Tax=Leptospira ryugenii TaxID=1917863 RepID=A0A2P2E5D9_9LEPT|nr:hypothetical protein [Leptospira ryugenii]GBF52087.1 hypothetical protein LPTSP4_36250 [Leptospira ryugenii]
MKQLNTGKITLLSLGLLGILTLLGVSFFYRYHFPLLSDDHSNWGQFGDFFGGLSNGILSFLSLIAILYTLHLQREELALNRRELELNRVEMQTANELAQKQSEIAEFQLQNAIRQKNEQFLMEYSKVYTSLENDLVDKTSSLTGIGFLKFISKGSLAITLENEKLIYRKGKSISAKPVFKFFQCLEYLIQWDFQQSKQETGFKISEGDHKNFSSSYSTLIQSFCPSEEIVELKESNFLNKLGLSEKRFPNIARFISD